MIERNFSFSQFIKMVCGDFYDLDIHWKSYNQYIPKVFLSNAFVGKVENFKNDFYHVCKLLDIPYSDIPHTNKTTHSHFSEYYNRETRNLVIEKHYLDFKTFGYDFS
jgi:hypothetical protein